MQLREYQDKGIKAIGQKLARGIRKLVVQLATGGGKTIMFSAISHRYTKRTKKSVLILVHRKELLQQTRRTLFNAFNIQCQVIVAGMKHIPKADVYVGMVESVNKRVSLLRDIGLVIIDEAHLNIHYKMHDHFPDQYIIGFTATPLSANNRKPLNMYYDDIVCCVDIPELITNGSLCQNITYAPKDVVDRSALAVKNGEFDDALMSLSFSKPKYINNTVDAYRRWSLGNKTIVFNVNIDHSLQVTQAFIAAGFNCRHVDGGTPSHERDRILNWFHTTPDAILCNVGILTAGFDSPSIETVIMNRSTLSMPLWLQCTGRGSRPTPAKSAFTIIDLGGNAVSLGDWNSPRDWENIFLNPPKKSEDGVAPSKNCPECEAIIPASSRVCQHCGYEYPAKETEPEELLSEFVVVTRGIDVAQIIASNKHRKEYYPFFKIGTDLAKSAKQTVPVMTDENANFILQHYHTLAKEWCKITNLEKKLKREELISCQNEFANTPDKKMALQKQIDQLKNITYNQWHQERAKEHLYTELAKTFKKWPNPLLVSTPESASLIQPIQPLSTFSSTISNLVSGRI